MFSSSFFYSRIQSKFQVKTNVCMLFTGYYCILTPTMASPRHYGMNWLAFEPEQGKQITWKDMQDMLL